MNSYLILKTELQIILKGLRAMKDLQDPDGDPLGILIQNSATEYWLQERYNALLRLDKCTVTENMLFQNSEFEGLLKMIASPDRENLHLAKAIIESKLKEHEQRIYTL